MLTTVLIIGLALAVTVYIIAGCRSIMQKIFNINLSLAEGFLGLVALQHLIAVPILLTNGSFQTYYLLLFILLVGVVAFHTYRLAQQDFWTRIKRVPLTKSGIALVLAVMLIIGATQVFVRYNHDDSFNISMITQSIDEPSLYTTEFSTGDPDLPVVPFYRLMSWELLLAAIVKTSTLSANVVAHTLIPMVVIGLSYLAYRRLFFVLFRDQSLANKATLALLLFHIFGAVSRFVPGLFLLGGSWRGKSILATIVLPVILTRLIEFYDQRKTNKDRRYIAILTLSTFAATALNPSSIYLLFATFVPFALYMYLRKKPIKRVALLLFPLLPLLALGLIILEASRAFVRAYSPISDAPLEVGLWDDVLSSYFGSYHVLFIATLVGIAAYIVAIRKSYPHQHVIFPAIILLVTFLNPVLIGLVSDNFTSPATYWRLYWIMPVGILVGSLGALLFTTLKKIPISALALGALILVSINLPKNYIFNESNGFTYAQNIEKLPPNILEATKFIQANGSGTVLAYEPGAIYARTITDSIDLIWSRQQYFLGYLDPESEEFIERWNLFLFAENKDWDRNDFAYYRDLMKKYDVEWFWTTRDRFASTEPVVAGEVTYIENEVIVKLY